MSRKNNGSILIITVFVFLFVNIIAINCSALILSNTRYILKEVDKTLTNTNDYDSFKEYIVSDNFLNTIKNIQDDDLNNTTYQINRTDLNDKNNIYLSRQGLRNGAKALSLLGFLGGKCRIYTFGRSNRNS